MFLIFAHWNVELKLMKLENTFKLLMRLVVVAFAAVSGQAFAQALSPNGYSGLGLVPSAN